MNSTKESTRRRGTLEHVYLPMRPRVGATVLFAGALLGGAAVAMACSSSDDAPASPDAGGVDAGSSSSSSSSSGGGASSSGDGGEPVDAALPQASDCDSLTADDGHVTFSNISADAMMKVQSIEASSVGGRPEDALFIKTSSGGESAQFGINYRGKLAAGVTFDVVGEHYFFSDGGFGDGKADADYIEIYDGVHSRVWVSLGGGTVTIVCVKDLDPDTGEATIIATFDGIKMGLPPQQQPVDWKGSFTASGIYRHRAKK